MYQGRTISVVLPTYNERDSIRACIEGFEQTGVVDEIIVVNNNAAEGTSEAIAPTSAIEIMESRQGYGSAIVRGMREASSDLICVCEPDGTFDAKDLFKMLPYSGEVDIVYGTRTVGEFIWQDANMGWFLRLGNWGVAKLVEVLFNTNSLSDVGCTLRVMNRAAVEQLLPMLPRDGQLPGRRDDGGVPDRQAALGSDPGELLRPRRSLLGNRPPTVGADGRPENDLGHPGLPGEHRPSQGPGGCAGPR